MGILTSNLEKGCQLLSEAQHLVSANSNRLLNLTAVRVELVEA